MFNSGISAKTSCEEQIGGSLCALLSSVDLYGCCDRLVGLESGFVFASGREREREFGHGGGWREDVLVQGGASGGGLRRQNIAGAAILREQIQRQTHHHPSGERVC